MRNARVRIIELRNDLTAVTNDIARVLEAIYDPSTASPPGLNVPIATGSANDDATRPFARVDGVAPSSPAAEAVRAIDLSPFQKLTHRWQGMQREDLVVKFGHLTSQSFTSSSLQMLAELVAVSENVRYLYQIRMCTGLKSTLKREISIQILRLDQSISLKLTPRKGWGGRGMLGSAPITVLSTVYPCAENKFYSCHIVSYTPP